MHEMKDDKASFPTHTIDLDNVKVLIRPEQAEGAKGKIVIIGKPMPKNINDKIHAREVTMEKTPDGKESLKIVTHGESNGNRERARQLTGYFPMTSSVQKAFLLTIKMHLSWRF